MSDYIKGSIVSSDDLHKTYKEKKRPFVEKKVPYVERERLEKEGWEVSGPISTGYRMRKAKSIDESFEDEIWCLFYKMGFMQLNKDRHLLIRTGPDYKQIDVFAVDDTGRKVFIVECKANTEMGPRSLKRDINDFNYVSKELKRSVDRFFGDKKSVTYIFATKNIQWSGTEEKIMESFRSKRLFLWKEEDIKYLHELATQLGSCAKYQLYSLLFQKTKISELGDIEVPAICGKFGRNLFYSFIIQPEKLLQFGYIHHRMSKPKELKETYQRMLSKSRLRSIDNFITAGGNFPNNIIINFTKSPGFERIGKKVGDISFGILKFPKYYASCWIIDGQHRLYGFADNPYKTESTVPVLAFDKLRSSEQAKLFVDINKNQKSVGGNLMWDLSTDIYHDSGERDQKILATISQTVKNLNLDEDSPVKDCIIIPSHQSAKANLTMTTLCAAIESIKILTTDFNFFKDDFQEGAKYLSDRLKVYLKTVKDLYPEDWNLRNDGFLCTNIGIGVLR